MDVECIVYVPYHTENCRANHKSTPNYTLMLHMSHIARIYLCHAFNNQILSFVVPLWPCIFIKSPLKIIIYVHCTLYMIIVCTKMECVYSIYEECFLMET